MEKAQYQKGTRLFESSYIIDDIISDIGATAQIYLVHRAHEPNVKFAAKVIYRIDSYTDAYWKKFADEEVTSLRIMNQENLVQTYETFSVNTPEVKAKVFIMEYVEGIILTNYLNQHGCLLPKVALGIFKKILIGIKTLHNYKHQIIHRDLNPNNIILSKTLSKVTVLDFGIATVLQDAQDALESKNIKCFTNEDKVNGTKPYITPDVLQRLNTKQPVKITVQYDFYSLGVILYEMIMGVRPFDYDKLPAGTKDNKILSLPLEFDIYNISSNPNITPSIENLIFRCLASKPEDLKFRYTKIEEIIEDCDKAIASLNLPEDKTPLLKPINLRRYPKAERYDIEVIKNKPKFYKRTWFLLVMLILAIALIVVSLLLFFVL